MPISKLLMTLSACVLFSTQPAQAELPANCSVTTLTNPERSALDCGTIILELGEGTVLQYFGDNNGVPQSLTIKSGSALVDVEPGSQSPRIRTPHAIAAVRGTIYAIEVSDGATSVFVLRGTVDVNNRRGTSKTATLSAGQGVEVIPRQPFFVEEWDDTRVRDLLARFGR
ncbi:MAG: FecR family protein [Roseobacter sp.]